ncbi:putative signal transduction protein [Candidatus Terasakiella magnetica]|uniref:Putative signal transduction protein n=1 Tax=Candidatus Terasakiella magnetica TaxID=1867952 RepID=A0A1C3RHW7_9PROT|nr:diguanylate cyclase [Candidatus Terasakiella magnetica]SCA56881.1 putative signal transduction protein [Candidatus Terasakiella magnetica]
MEHSAKNLSDAIQWDHKASINKFVLMPAFWAIPVLIWSLIVALSLFHNLTQIEKFTLETAANKGRFIFSMVEDVRLWNARHGGVYVETTDKSPSNPYLKDPQKDIVTTKGRKLTKLNPAYMTRQIAGVIKENSDTLIHLTSLNPINPGNVADEWEKRALKSFEETAKERFEFIEFADVQSFRYMAPLMTANACLDCHEHQGYQVGDVRGGISVSFNATSYMSAQDQQIQNQIILHASIWALLCSLTLMGLKRLRHQLTLLIDVNKRQEEIVHLRTQDLREESRKRHETQAQFRRFIDASAEGIVALDTDGVCTFANPKAASLFKLPSTQDILGKDFHHVSGHHIHPLRPSQKEDCAIVQCFQDGKEHYSDNEFFKKSDGASFPVEYFASPVYEQDKLIGAIVTFVDVTDRKQRESELNKLSKAVTHSPATTLITDKKGRIEYVNKRFCEVTGYSEEEVIGKTPRLLKSGHTAPEVYKDIWNTLLQGDEWHGELLNRKKDGTLFWEECLISPITDTFGEVTHFVAVNRDITDFKVEMDEAWRQANFDQLTKLPNRSLLEDRLENAVSLALREKRSLALLFIDLDGFKQVNDTYGHDAGDHVLQITAKRLQEHIRQSDTAARLGGDEFVVILHEPASIEGVENVAHKIINELSKETTFKEDKMAVSASIGIALMPRDTSNANELLRFADVAMYGAKQDGKNGFCHYDRFTRMPTSQD